MDACSSGEDLMVKTRKPYTITKQRERWTEDEHKRFLEALKLHGRAWQRIEEHIGTKTAVQIRSHAQKFFSKLEKEALVKGIPVAQAIDIEIPPPRPKRKPNNPYPRKTCSVGAPLTSLVRPKDGCQVISSSSCQKKQVLGLEKDLSPEKSCGDGVRENEEEKGGTVCSQRFTCYQEVSSEIKSTVSSGESVRGLCHFPSVKSSLDKTGSNKPQGGAIEARGNHLLCDAIAANDVQNCGAETEIHGSQKFPMQVPVQILDGTLTTRTSSQVPSSDVSYQEFGFHQLGGIPPHPAPFTGPAMESQSSTSRSDSQHNFPSFYPPFAASFPGNQEDYCSLLNMSSVFSRLIIATLQQNPAAHAAASYAAAFWPTGTTTNMEDSADTAAGHIGGLPNRQINSPASLSAIVTATVAAATAWWAAHGLFPYCAPYPGGFTCSPSPTAMGVSPNINIGQPLGTVGNKEREENKTGLSPEQLVQKPDPRFSPEVLAHNSASKSSLFESGDSMGPKIMEGITPTTDDLEKKKIEDETEQNESSKGKNDNSNNNQNKKQVDRSSCGSNSSSDIETDALEKNHDKGTVEEAQELKGQPDPNQETAVGESSSRRNRNLSNSGDSWKEVSDEGRMAFQALFLREKLPQSFSPPRSGKNKENNSSSDKEIGQTALERNGNKTKLDLNSTTMESCSSLVGTDSASNEAARGYKKELGSLSIGLGQGRLKVGRTGFKPYKRCSVEARETRVANGSSQDQEKGPKRLRLEGEAST